MILMVPYSPEVPKHQKPRLTMALLSIIVLGAIYLQIHPVLTEDRLYVDQMPVELQSMLDGKLNEEAHVYLSKRPLLRISPAKGDWDLKRLLYSNFVHGSEMHLLLNLIGVFAGVRICSTFLSPLGVSLIFLIGGSIGLLLSVLLTTQISQFIPHVGASAGIFALMGAYYVYNFRFRTQYFYWFPTRHGAINLKTSWFFFFDVFLIELLLTSGQLFPNRIDTVDHLAHVVGFLAGGLLAILSRRVRRWPEFIQIRTEFEHWKKVIRPKYATDSMLDSKAWLQLLAINPYNDAVKIRLCGYIQKNLASVDDEVLSRAFAYYSPTFIRLHTVALGPAVAAVLRSDRALPQHWLQTTPYDSVIRLAQQISRCTEDQPLLVKLVLSYQKAHPESGAVNRKLELLMNRLSGIIPQSKDDQKAS